MILELRVNLTCNKVTNSLQVAAQQVVNALWVLMEAGIEDLKLLQTTLLLVTTNNVVQHDSLAKVRGQLRCFILWFIHSHSGATGIVLPICRVLYFWFGAKMTDASS